MVIEGILLVDTYAQTVWRGVITYKDHRNNNRGKKVKEENKSRKQDKEFEKDQIGDISIYITYEK